MNYFEQVAHILGVELYEEFNIKSESEERSKAKFRITEVGTERLYDGGWNSTDLLNELVSGYYQIVKIPFKPKCGDKYYCYDVIDKYAWEYVWQDMNYDYTQWKIGNCFRTKEEAETKGKELMEKIKREYEES